MTRSPHSPGKGGRSWRTFTLLELGTIIGAGLEEDKMKVFLKRVEEHSEFTLLASTGCHLLMDTYETHVCIVRAWERTLPSSKSSQFKHRFITTC